MYTKHIKRFLIGLFIVLLPAAQGFAQVAARDQRDQALIDVELLKRAEDRADALRTQLLDLQMKEIDLQARLDDLDYRLRPESLNQALVFVGSVRPMDELRDDLRARIESEKARVNEQLELLASTQAKLEAAISDADSECARLRQRLRLLRSSDGCQDGNEAAPGGGES
jgi:predicted  nucleic acid-binding Zn-ribbon protein